MLLNGIFLHCKKRAKASTRERVREIGRTLSISGRAKCQMIEVSADCAPGPLSRSSTAPAALSLCHYSLPLSPSMSASLSLSHCASPAWCLPAGAGAEAGQRQLTCLLTNKCTHQEQESRQETHTHTHRHSYMHTHIQYECKQRWKAKQIEKFAAAREDEGQTSSTTTTTMFDIFALTVPSAHFSHVASEAASPVSFPCSSPRLPLLHLFSSAAFCPFCAPFSALQMLRWHPLLIWKWALKWPEGMSVCQPVLLSFCLSVFPSSCLAPAPLVRLPCDVSDWLLHLRLININAN